MWHMVSPQYHSSLKETQTLLAASSSLSEQSARLCQLAVGFPPEFSLACRHDIGSGNLTTVGRKEGRKKGKERKRSEGEREGRKKRKEKGWKQGRKYLFLTL